MIIIYNTFIECPNHKMRAQKIWNDQIIKNPDSEKQRIPKPVLRVCLFRQRLRIDIKWKSYL